jgi:hypothetical protein
VGGKAAAMTPVGVAQAGALGRYDILVLDVGYKQSMAGARSLGRAGMRVVVSECFVECDPALPVLAFQSRYSSCNVVLPSYAAGPDAFASAVLDFIREHPTRVAPPTGDGVISALAPHRHRFDALGCMLGPTSAKATPATATSALASRLGSDLSRRG